MIRPGDKVRHPKAPEWGLGKVLEVSEEGTALAFFLHTGEKRLDLAYAGLEKTKAGYHPILDHPTFPLRAKGRLPWALPEARLAFLDTYPKGFEDENYVLMERRPKERACQLLKESLDEGSFRALLATESFGEIRSRAMDILACAQMATRNDRQLLLEALKTPEHQERFAEGLSALLYGSKDFEDRFSDFAHCLYPMGLDRWTLLTCFPALADAETHLCFQPDSLLPVASLLKADLECHASPQWSTYQRALEFARHLQTELGALGMASRDMWDVQAFINWTAFASVMG